MRIPPMLAAVQSAAIIGIDAYDVIVEVDASQGLPQWTIVGLPVGAVKESRERVGSALVNSGFKLPPRRITINLAPADVRKEGTAFDLPIALGILVATEQLPAESVDRRVFVGELGLDGTVRGIRGALPIARRAAGRPNLRELIVPRTNVAEAGRVTSLRLAAPEDLRTLATELRMGTLSIPQQTMVDAAPGQPMLDFSDVVGQETAKRALEVAAAGGHNLCMTGPPGAGKTMLARRLPGILPELSETESLEVIAIQSVAGILPSDVPAVCARPFRAPHHSISSAGLIGGGSTPRPGEVSLAHHGVLFLDEMLEFPRSVLEGLRQPMEDGRVVISRAAMSVAFPAMFTLVGATNPCPCGRLGDGTASCTCSTNDVQRYAKRISGPLADRIDMHVTVGRVALTDLSAVGNEESSTEIRRRVCIARARQNARYARMPGVACNVHAAGRWIDAHGGVTSDARALLHRAAEGLALSARGYHRVLKVARTIADLDESSSMSATHVAEALRYRQAMAR
jgi:magnesium chelatase family protein